MIKKSPRNERIIIFVVGIVIGALLGGTFHKETVIVREGTADTPAAQSSVNIMIDDGHGSVRTWNTVSWHEAFSVMDLLDLMASTGNITFIASPDRTKVISINAISTSGTSSERWQYWVNNTYEPKIASKYYLKPGDIVVWKFIKELGK